MKTIGKIAFALMMFLAFTIQVNAQKTKEWLSQKKTQKEYLVQQIAALQMYISYTKEGYKIAQKGLNTIGTIKDGEFNLHRDFFNSHVKVNPNIKKYRRVADIIALQRKILLTYSKDFAAIKRNEGLLSHEVEYTESVYDRVVENCNHLIDDLILLVTDGNYKMSDDQRIQQIDALYLEMQEILGFTQTFGKEAIALGISRVKEKEAIQYAKELMDLKTD